MRASSRLTGPLAETVRNRQGFWTHYSERHPEDGVKANHGTSNFWIRPHIDGPRISLMLARREVGIFFTTARGFPKEQLFGWLRSHSGVIHRELRINVDENQSCYQGEGFDAFDRDNWDAMSDWLHRMLQLYLRVFDAETRKLTDTGFTTQ